MEEEVDDAALVMSLPGADDDDDDDDREDDEEEEVEEVEEEEPRCKSPSPSLTSPSEEGEEEPQH